MSTQVPEATALAGSGDGMPGQVEAAQHEAVARRLYEELWNERRYELAGELFHPGFRHPSAPGLSGGAAKVAAIRWYHTAFPDLWVVVDDLVAAPGRIAVRFTLSGTDTGGLRGRPPTGRAVRAWAVDFLTFRDDLIIGEWVGSDWLGTLVQLGVLPSPWQDAG